MWLFDELLSKSGTQSSIAWPVTGGSSGTSWSITPPGGQAGGQDPLVSISVPTGIKEDQGVEILQTPKTPIETPTTLSSTTDSTISISDVVDLAPSPMATPTLVEDAVTGEAQITAVIPESSASAEQSVALNPITVTVAEEEPTNTIVSNPQSEVPQIFNIIESTPEETEWANITSETAQFDELSAPTKDDEGMHTTESFLSKAIDDINVMIGNMQAHHDEKLSEADGYRAQKEHFAALELAASQEADSMIEEQNKAEKMRNYLQNELDWKNELPSKSSVSTTLAEVETKESVSKTIKRQTQKAKAPSLI